MADIPDPLTPADVQQLRELLVKASTGTVFTADDCRLYAVCIDALPALLDAAEERDALLPVCRDLLALIEDLASPTYDDTSFALYDSPVRQRARGIIEAADAAKGAKP